MKYNFVKLLQGGGITDTSNSGEFNRADVNKSYLGIYKEMLANPSFDLNAYNDFLGRYYTLRRGSGFDPTSGKAMEYEGVKQYQTDFNTYGFHTNPFMLGWQHSSTAYTGDNFDSGVWDPTKNADNWFGSTTALRYANSWNDEELALANADANKHGLEWVLDERAGSIDTGDGRKFYKLLKMNESPSESNKPEGELGSSDVLPGDNEGNSRIIGTNNPLEFSNPNKPEKTPWTDWIPLSIQLWNNLASAKRQADLQKKMKFPLVEAPYEQFKRKNQYHLRSQMLQQANDLRTLGAYRSNSSDIRENMDNMFKYDTLAASIENLAEQIKAQADAQDREKAIQATNRNIQRGVEAANLNTKSNVAAWNNILDAKARHDLRQTEALNSYIGNMYTSHGEWLKDARLNNQAYQKGLNAQQATLKQQEAYNKYYDTVNDFSKSKAFNDFWEAVKQPGKKILVDDPADYENIEKIKALWAGDSDLAKEYRAKWEDEKQNALTDYYLTNQNIANKLAYKNLLSLARINNQGFRFLDRPPIFRHSRGGSLRSRLIDYENHVQKEQLKQKELQHKRNELSQKRLIADLDRLSREQSILLRSVFK